MPKSQPAKAKSALVLIDVINGFDFEGSGAMVRAATRAAPKIEALSERARRERVPVVYVNDNFGRWRSDFKAIVAACTAPDQPGHAIAGRLRPKEGDYFVLKPRHSGFYSTALEVLLQHLRVDNLVLCGFAANMCVEFTANDAYIRGYSVVVPSDCTGANTPELTKKTLHHIRTTLSGQIPASRHVVFGRGRGRNVAARASLRD
jgi:nicotinamidase-related amidase